MRLQNIRYMCKQVDIESLKHQLLGNKKITIVTHHNPDGDAIGASLALRQHLTQMGHQVSCIIPNLFPEFLAWMHGTDQIINAEKHLRTARKHLSECDILFVVDMNGAHRSGEKLAENITKSPAYKIHIDHHIDPQFPCDFCFSETNTTSTCEMVYRFIKEYLGNIETLSKETAECIYTGIITDTGSLSYSCNNPITYEILQHLISLGVDAEQIHRQVYDNYNISRLTLLGTALNNLKVMEDYETSYMFLSQQNLIDNNFQQGDTEGFVNYGLSIKCAKFTAFFTDRKDRIRVSFRSKGKFDVSKFAAEYFNGGGHRNAAAGNYYKSLEETIKYFEEIVHNHPELRKK